MTQTDVMFIVVAAIFSIRITQYPCMLIYKIPVMLYSLSWYFYHKLRALCSIPQYSGHKSQFQVVSGEQYMSS